MNKKRAFRIIGIVLLVALLGIASYYALLDKNREKAIVDTEFNRWAVNQDNKSQVYFNYFIYNYGDKEAKDVEVRCSIKDSRGEELSHSVQGIGNIASETSSFREMYHSDKNIESKLTSNSSAVCYIESCEDCEILYKKIPELVEHYE